MLDISVAFTHEFTLFSTQDILAAYTVAFKVLPSVLWLGSSLSNRHETLIRNDISNLASGAVAFALQTSHTSLAVEYFEQGLSTTHKQKLQLTDDYTHLKTHLPTLSQKFHQVSLQLQSSSRRSDHTINYHALANERLELLAKIHQHPGFENFLLPPKYSYLSQAAMHGPVIMLNVGPDKTDALIILSRSTLPVHLCLSSVSEPAVVDCKIRIKNSLDQFFIHSRETRYGRPHKLDNISPDKNLQSVITWLWKSVVKPIFEVLEKNGIYGGRLWWCPSGPFTYFPLHAAAPIDSPFIHSYIPTLDSLIQANLKDMPIDDTLTAVGIVGTSANIKAWAMLPSVEGELLTITTLFGKKAQQLMDAQATVQSVLEKIQSSSWIHLACHGHQDFENPLKSGLILYDGQLELQSILDINLPNAKFVYLSACETAMGDSKLVNEAMHLAGGFLAAGFQGAIGTLWSMPDAYGPRVSEVAAEGLHLAIQKLRKEDAPPHQWMPFVHFGI
ncbi:CHAT domain-containing protein [Collybia nuda]|uniref:CHAT domain-containing protein n=1 Tax=Collybia nuda TaxID=64659 RepID=A0A9P5Y7W6_9AGAR|nr:CHAT domain-containing protein [Collybia nuda]